MSKKNCVCGSDLEYEKCCALYIENGEPVPNASVMVRSRFAAFSLQKYEYLIESTHPDFRDDVTAEDIRVDAKDVKWIKLELGEEKEYVSPEGEKFKQLSFVAYYEKDKRPAHLAETSFFKEKDDRLYYVDSVENKPRAYKRIGEKIGRNDSCPCGSNKKYKKCCGK